MACAPPSLKTRRRRTGWRSSSTAGSAVPSARGGVQMIRVGQPAIRAGTREHDRCGGQGRDAGRHVEPDRVDRPELPLADDAGHRLDAQRSAELRFMEAPHVGDGAVDRCVAARLSSAVSAAANSAVLTSIASSATPSKRRVNSSSAASPRRALRERSRARVPGTSARALLRRAAQRLTALLRRQRRPVEDGDSHAVRPASSRRAAPGSRSRRRSSGSRAFPRTRSRGTRRGPRLCR